MRQRRPKLVAARVALVLAAAAAGCGVGGDAGGPSASSSSESSASAAGRRPMPSCGAYQAPVGEVTAEARTARDCFLAAFGAGREAELTITATSLEGDPVTTVYRVLGPNDVELLVDASADRFAAVPTYRQRCTSVVEEGAGLAAGGCTTG